MVSITLRCLLLPGFLPYLRSAYTLSMSYVKERENKKCEFCAPFCILTFLNFKGVHFFNMAALAPSNYGGAAATKQSYWQGRFDANNQMYTCPWCDRGLKGKLSQSANNPTRGFVSCSKDYGGCGLFCFLDDEPNEQFNPRGQKRARSQGTNIVGPVVNKPDVHEQRLAELVTEFAEVKKHLSEVRKGQQEVLDYLKQ